MDLESCPSNLNVWLLTRFGKAIDGKYTGQQDVVGWCPKPKIPPHLKEKLL